MKAIVLDGHLKSALTCVRSLGAKNISVAVGAERGTGMALHSKYTREKFVYPSPYSDQDDFIVKIKEIASSCDEKPVVYTCSDATYLTLYEYRDVLKDVVTIAYPSEQSVAIAFDKMETCMFAREYGVPTIETFYPKALTDLEAVMGNITFPSVLKTRRSVTWKNGKGVFGTASFVHGAEQLREKFVAISGRIGEPPLVQQFVEGDEYGVEMLTSNGMCVAPVIHKRIRSMSPTGGASVLKETVKESNLTKKMYAYATTLARELLWNGPIMFEFKVDSKSNIPLLMEINGRLWGSLPLAVAAGVDIPYLQYMLARGGKIDDETIEARSGVVTQHFLGDVRHLLRVWFAKDEMRSKLYPSRVKAFMDFLFLPRGTQSDVWSMHDLKPGIMEYADVIMNIKP